MENHGFYLVSVRYIIYFIMLNIKAVFGIGSKKNFRFKLGSRVLTSARTPILYRRLTQIRIWWGQLSLKRWKNCWYPISLWNRMSFPWIQLHQKVSSLNAHAFPKVITSYNSFYSFIHSTIVQPGLITSPSPKSSKPLTLYIDIMIHKPRDWTSKVC